MYSLLPDVLGGGTYLPSQTNHLLAPAEGQGFKKLAHKHYRFRWWVSVGSHSSLHWCPAAPLEEGSSVFENWDGLR